MFWVLRPVPAGFRFPKWGFLGLGVRVPLLGSYIALGVGALGVQGLSVWGCNRV